MDKKLISFLDENKILYKSHSHPAVFKVEDSKNISQISSIPGLRTKNLFLRDENKNYYLVSLRGEKRLNIKNLKKELFIKDLKFATAEELKEELNLTPGSVSIFGLIYSKNVLLILDKEVFDSDIVSFHPNINTSTLELNHKELIKFLKSIKIKYRVFDL